VHPEVFSSYMDGELLLEIKEEIETELREDLPSLKPEEAAVLTLLQERLSREVKKQEEKPAKKRRSAPRKAQGKSQPEIRP
jgi:DNA topoisomerase-1